MTFDGSRQTAGDDFDKTFSPTVAYEAVRLFFAILSSMCWPLIQTDFVTAFLNAMVDHDDIYLRPLKGFRFPPWFKDLHPGLSDEDFIWRLKRALYGLKQAPRSWYLLVSSLLTDLGFEEIQMYHCFFTREEMTSAC